MAIIPGTVKPVVSLVLLAIILGIPAVLIVVTSRKVAYLGWMLIYLMSLPIWNFVLPFYAFLHMVSSPSAFRDSLSSRMPRRTTSVGSQPPVHLCAGVG